MIDLFHHYLIIYLSLKSRVFSPNTFISVQYLKRIVKNEIINVVTLGASLLIFVRYIYGRVVLNNLLKYVWSRLEPKD